MDNNINNNQIVTEQNQVDNITSNENIAKKKKIPSPIIIVLLIILAFLIYRKYNGNISFFGLKSNTCWKNFEFSVDGVKKRLPLTTEELMKDLPDGWELTNIKKSKEKESAYLVYNGSDKSISSEIYIGINSSTQKIYEITVNFSDLNGLESRLEICGVNENTVEPDLTKIVGPPTHQINGKKSIEQIPQTKGWGYTYYVNGRSVKDGGFLITGNDKETGKIDTMSLIDKKNAPKTEKK